MEWIGIATRFQHMKFNRYWLYPQVRNWRRIIPCILLGGIIGGAYGAIHDQISYTISPEYFTFFKFHQFHYADFGLPNRVFVAIIGFLATWCLSLILRRKISCRRHTRGVISGWGRLSDGSSRG